MTRQSPNICNLAIFFLVLLLNHETITVANRITESIKIRQQLKGNTFANNIMSMIKKIEADGDDFTSFLEVKDMQGMSAEQYATHEIKEMHKSLKEGFSFKNSPILEELKELNNIPESQKVLSLDQLKKHRYEISILLEKAMDSPGAWAWHHFNSFVQGGSTEFSSHRFPFLLSNHCRCFSHLSTNIHPKNEQGVAS